MAGIRLNRLRAFVPSDAATSGAITIPAGAGRPLVALKNPTPDAPMRVLVLGATQHPQSLYSYEADGSGFTLPFPLGTLANPLYTCHHLGGYLEFQDSFTISVENRGDKPHRYAAIVLVEPTTSRR